MALKTSRLNVLILATYLLAVILPILAMGEGGHRSMVDHDRMMAMSGHVMPMSETDDADDRSMNLICQQHCMFAVAVMPLLHRAAEPAASASDAVFGAGQRWASLAFPPPGPPPKASLI